MRSSGLTSCERRTAPACLNVVRAAGRRSDCPWRCTHDLAAWNEATLLFLRKYSVLNIDVLEYVCLTGRREENIAMYTRISPF